MHTLTHKLAYKKIINNLTPSAQALNNHVMDHAASLSVVLNLETLYKLISAAIYSFIHSFILNQAKQRMMKGLIFIIILLLQPSEN